GDVEIALFVDMAEIAVSLPAIDRFCVGANIFVGRVRSAIGEEVDFSHLSGGTFLSLFIENSHAETRLDAADRSLMRKPFVPGDRRAAEQFGAAIDFENAVRPQPVDPGLLQPLRTDRS